MDSDLVISVSWTDGIPEQMLVSSSWTLGDILQSYGIYDTDEFRVLGIYNGREVLQYFSLEHEGITDGARIVLCQIELKDDYEEEEARPDMEEQYKNEILQISDRRWNMLESIPFYKFNNFNIDSDSNGSNEFDVIPTVIQRATHIMEDPLPVCY